MRLQRLLTLAGGLLLAASGCSDSTGPSGDDGGDPGGPPVITSFQVADPTITHGEWTQLRWQVARADLAVISGHGNVTPPTGGALSIRPHESASYTLSVSNNEGTATATVTVEVVYPAGFFVDPGRGDDARSGASPAESIKTLEAALARAQGGGFIFLAAGTFDSNVVIDGADVSISGGLDPVTFFLPEPDQQALFTSSIRPSAGTPLIIRNVAGLASRISNLELDNTVGGGELPVLVENATAVFTACRMNGRASSSGVGLRILGSSNVTATRCRVFGGRPGAGTYAETAGVQIRGTSSALITNCFIDGGTADLVSSGVDVQTSGTVRIGLNTISANSGTVGGQFNAAAIRIREGHPAIGGNILFTRGISQGFGVVEQAADTDPEFLEYNLFISVDTPPYDNFGPNDPNSQADLNDGNLTLESRPLNTYQNLLETGVSASTILVSLTLSDYHLKPLPSGPNPAVDRGGIRLSSETYGFVVHDIDGQRRPSIGELYDLGADEL